MSYRVGFGQGSETSALFLGYIATIGLAVAAVPSM
jgi:hypothetical protein